MKHKAIFLDRDGTIIEDTGYVDAPEKVKLLPGSGDAIRRLNQSGYLVVVASNQSGIARGLFDEETLSKVHIRMEELLDEEGAEIDGAYYCPYLDGEEAVVESYRRKSKLRKPEPGLLQQAASEMKIDLDLSWMVGDTLSDVEAGARAGCKTILVDPDGKSSDNGNAKATHVVKSLEAAVKILSEQAAKQSEKSSAKSSTRTRGKARGRRTNGTSSKPAKAEPETSLPLPASVPITKVSPPRPARQDENNDAVLSELKRIRDLLKDTQRKNRQEDFSLRRLFGALLQMFAIFTALWGLAALFSNQADAATSPAAARFMLACFLQLTSISFFAIDRFR